MAAPLLPSLLLGETVILFAALPGFSLHGLVCSCLSKHHGPACFPARSRTSEAPTASFCSSVSRVVRSLYGKCLHRISLTGLSPPEPDSTSQRPPLRTPSRNQHRFRIVGMNTKCMEFIQSWRLQFGRAHKQYLKTGFVPGGGWGCGGVCYRFLYFYCRIYSVHTFCLGQRSDLNAGNHPPGETAGGRSFM